MELWIRSQNKGALIKVEMLGNIDGTIYSYLGTNQTKLGTYKTGERALEILDEIHQRLIDLQTLEIAPDFRSTTRSMECVYEMPIE